jgi:hypothetical protein
VDVHPVTADAVTEIVRKIAATPPDLIAAAKRAKGEPDVIR